jgi:ribose transport system ATP-binding protein
MPKLLSMQRINKSFFGVRVLKDVDFDLKAGEVHVLLGENGAGKSTLIKILSGAYTLDSGEIQIDGQRIDPHTYSPREANRRGIATIYQTFHLVPHLSVAENIALSNFATRYGVIAWKTIYWQAREVLSTVQFEINPRIRVQDLSVAEKQMLEIAMALSQNAKILIMDEPTAAISKKETETLFNCIREITQKGIGIIYISHKLEELKQIGQRLTTLRDGCNVGTLALQDLDLNDVIKLMTGHVIQQTQQRREYKPQAIWGEFRHLSAPTIFQDINFRIHEGEILGLTGLVGAGKTEVARTMMGIDPLPQGEIQIRKRSVRIHSPEDAIRHGVGYLPEDRDVDGLCLNMGVQQNISLAFLAKLRAWFFSNRQEILLAHTFVRNLHIKTPHIAQYVKYLSGGNKQKVIFAKWLSAECQFLILDEPTIGIDVGTREEIYTLIREFVKEQGKCVLFISSDIQEILNIADRILVMARGKLVAEVQPAQATKRLIMEYCLTAQ